MIVVFRMRVLRRPMTRWWLSGQHLYLFDGPSIHGRHVSWKDLRFGTNIHFFFSLSSSDFEPNHPKLPFIFFLFVFGFGYVLLVFNFFSLDLLYSFDFFLILSFNPNLACINFFPLWSSFFYFIYFFLNPFVQFLLIFNFIPQSKFMVHCFFFSIRSLFFWFYYSFVKIIFLFNFTIQ